MHTAELLERRYPGRRAALKRSILACALECFNTQGIEATTIEAIRLACDTSVGAIYHHFGNKEGLVAALFFAALDDQGDLSQRYLSEAVSARDGVFALVHSYVDWVSQQPDWARFLFHARFAVAAGPHREELALRNRERNRQVQAWMQAQGADLAGQRIPAELLPSMIIGQADSYCRAWLAGRVKGDPAGYREVLAEAAWRAIAG